MSRELNIRPICMDDAEALADLHCLAWSTAFPEMLPAYVIEKVNAGRQEFWKKVISENMTLQKQSRFLRAIEVLEDGEYQLSGFVDCGESRTAARTNVAEIYSIYIHPKAIGKGLGCALVQASIEYYSRLNFDLLEVWVLDVNEPARKFYKSQGMKQIGPVRIDHLHGHTIPHYCYELKLTPTH